MRGSNIVIMSNNVGKRLAASIAERLFQKTHSVKLVRFNDGEIRIEIGDNVRGEDVYIVAPTPAPADNIMEAILIADAARRSSAGKITLVLPYVGYSRQDRKDKPRVPLSAKVVYEMMSVSADHVLALDVHSEQTLGFFPDRVGVDHLFGSYVGIPYIRDNIPSPFVIASPDAGGSKRARGYADRLGQQNIAIFIKFRPEPGKIGKVSINGSVRGKNVVFVDDMIDTGGTLVTNAEAAVKAGAKDIYVFATHALLSKEAVPNLNKSPIRRIAITDSIDQSDRDLGEKFVVLSVADLLANAIRRLHDGRSISELIL
ncbi:MAG TPA: ribose-phosphate diphosphokinase [Candidatus Colwellbacteria bacterium]|nr:ribose-phosphate diphosphokinase [Candidatus Colwellbacteria bacterium]